MVRVIAIHILLVLLAIYLVQADNNDNDDILRYNNGEKPDAEAYLKFVRERLASENHAHGKPMNHQTGPVLTADNPKQGTQLRAAQDINSSGQALDAGTYSENSITYIIGLNYMCLQANGIYARLWLSNCDFGKDPNQQWELFAGDNTIRLHSDTSLCVTADGLESRARIILFKCIGRPSQKWTFMPDKTISNPYSGLVLDVPWGDVSLHEIILFTPKGGPNQKWSPM